MAFAVNRVSELKPLPQDVRDLAGLGPDTFQYEWHVAGREFATRELAQRFYDRLLRSDPARRRYMSVVEV